MAPTSWSARPAMLLLCLFTASRGGVSAAASPPSFDFPAGKTASGLCPGGYVEFATINSNTAVALSGVPGALRITQSANLASFQGNAITLPQITQGSNVRGVRFTYNVLSTADYNGMAGLLTVPSGTSIDLTTPQFWKKLSFAMVTFPPPESSFGIDIYELDAGASPGVTSSRVLSTSSPISTVYEISVNAEGKIDYWGDSQIVYHSTKNPGYPLAFVVSEMYAPDEIRAQWLVPCTTATATTTSTTTTSTPCDLKEPCEDDGADNEEVPCPTANTTVTGTTTPCEASSPSEDSDERAISRLYVEAGNEDFVAGRRVALAGSLAFLGTVAAAVAIAARRLSSQQAVQGGEQELLASDE